MKRGQKRYDLTMDGYENMFGEKPSDQDIWPKNVDKKPTRKKKAAKQKTEQAHTAKEGESEAQVKQEADEAQVNQEGKGDRTYDERVTYDSDEREYLDEYGDERGTTEAELIEWHRNAILDPSNNEGCDPNECAECVNGHQWARGEFNLTCDGCRQTSQELGGFTCG